MAEDGRKGISRFVAAVRNAVARHPILSWLVRRAVSIIRVMRANPLTLAGFVVVVVMAIAAILVAGLPPLGQLLFGRPASILPFGPSDLYLDNAFADPDIVRKLRIASSTLLPRFSAGGIVSGLTREEIMSPSTYHILGTDNLGRDTLSRVLAALPLDLVIGSGIAGISLVVGGGLGLVAGYWDRPRSIGGVISVIIMRFADIFLAFPSLVLALAIAASLGRGTLSSVLAILATWWPYYVRLVRGEVLTIKHQPYVMAARAAGVSELRILFRHVVRNLLEPLIVYYSLDIGTVIIVFSTISYIGVGAPPSTAEWGNMTESYKAFLPLHPWPVLAAGLAIFLAALAFSLLGDGLRDFLDPRSRRALTQAAAPSTVPAVATGPGGG